MSSISSIGFTAGGIDVNSIVTNLMQAERTPENAMLQNKSNASVRSQDVGTIRTGLLSLQAQAQSLLTGGFTKLTSSVSNSTVVSASASNAAQVGSLTFTVDALAAAQGLRTASTVASNTSVITTATSLAVSSTSNQIGVSSISVGAGTTTGPYTLHVLQATGGATQTGTAALAASTVIDSTDNTLDVQLDGVSKTVTVAAGTYTAAGLATAVTNAFNAAGGGATASVDAAGKLRLTSTHEGSAASLAITGGSAAAALQLANGSSNGIDGSLQIGTNAVATVTSAGTGDSVAVSTGTGTLNLTMSGGLRVGDSAVAVVSTGDRSLTAVSTAINNANVGVSAAAVNVTDGQWLLQLNSTKTGTANAIAIDGTAFAASGGLVQTSAASNAKITIGSGAGAYSVTSSSNAFSNVMPGVTINALAQSTGPVTVNVTRDDGSTADAVGNLINSANSLLASIVTQTQYDTKTNTPSALTNDTTVQRLSDQVRAAITSIVGTGTSALPGNAGITLKQDGTINFDRDAFTAALDNDPAGVARLFSRGGATTASLSFANATDNTVGGSYAVNVTTAATRATTGDILVGGSVAGQTIGVRVGSTVASYQASAGATTSEIVSGLNAALAQAGLKVNAEASNGGVRLTAIGFGGAGSFDTNLDTTGAGTWSTNTGTDVAGTINGVAAIGVGNQLSVLDGTSSPTSGLAINVAEGATGALANFSYDPGIAARLSSLATGLTGTNGALTTDAASYDQKVTDFNQQISDFEVRMTAKEAAYRAQWTAVQSSLQTLQNQQQWLTQTLG